MVNSFGKIHFAIFQDEIPIERFRADNRTAPYFDEIRVLIVYYRESIFNF